MNKRLDSHGAIGAGKSVKFLIRLKNASVPAERLSGQIFFKSQFGENFKLKINLDHAQFEPEFLFERKNHIFNHPDLEDQTFVPTIEIFEGQKFQTSILLKNRGQKGSDVKININSMESIAPQIKPSSFYVEKNQSKEFLILFGAKDQVGASEFKVEITFKQNSITEKVFLFKIIYILFDCFHKR